MDTVQWELSGHTLESIRSVTFAYRSQTVDGRDILLSGRVNFM